MHCVTCGDEQERRDLRQNLSVPRRFWSPDDGWRIGRFCRACMPLARAKPDPDDYAYAQRGDYLSDDDEAIAVLFG